LINAVDAIREVARPDEKGIITVRTRREADSAVVSIRDNGCGIPDSIREKVFDPFFTTKGIGKGSGQGLAIARSVIVEKHGGTLDVTSEAGKTTTFTLRIPLRGARDGAVQERAGNASGPLT
jgi:signal transduction histidine kinase